MEGCKLQSITTSCRINKNGRGTHEIGEFVLQARPGQRRRSKLDRYIAHQKSHNGKLLPCHINKYNIPACLKRRQLSKPSVYITEADHFCNLKAVQTPKYYRGPDKIAYSFKTVQSLTSCMCEKAPVTTHFCQPSGINPLPSCAKRAKAKLR